MSQFCDQMAGSSDELYWRGFSRNIVDRRIPFSGSLALTHACNLNCVHCYIKEEPGHETAVPELDTCQWLKIIGDIKEAGCLYLLLTGGEPLRRGDFYEIYSFAKQNGFLVTLFTNGTLISDRIAELFCKLPPRLVEVSLYGSNPGIHERITGIPGSFQLALQGIKRMLGLGIHVGMKSTLMTLNVHDLPAIESLARNFGVAFRLDPAIFPVFSGDRSPLDLRVSPELAVEQEFSDPDRVRELREFFDRYHNVRSGNSVYTCGAGMTTFHVDSSGNLYPCLMATKRKYSLREGFSRAWAGEISGIRDHEISIDSGCRECEKKLLCGYCPGLFELENGREQASSDYLCSLGKLRYEYITRRSLGG